MKEFVEKLIGRLEEEIIYDTFDHYKEEPLINMSFERLEDIINKLAEEYSADTSQKSANGWIPSSERLPQEDEWVLVTTANNDIDLNRVRNGKWIAEFRIEVIAWQPLPQPYQPKQQEPEWKDSVMKHFTKLE